VEKERGGQSCKLNPETKIISRMCLAENEWKERAGVAEDRGV
jgi:hypothetical protein